MKESTKLAKHEIKTFNSLFLRFVIKHLADIRGEVLSILFSWDSFFNRFCEWFDSIPFNSLFLRFSIQREGVAGELAFQFSFLEIHELAKKSVISTTTFNSLFLRFETYGIYSWVNVSSFNSLFLRFLTQALEKTS